MWSYSRTLIQVFKQTLKEIYFHIQIQKSMLKLAHWTQEARPSKMGAESVKGFQLCYRKQVIYFLSHSFLSYILNFLVPIKQQNPFKKEPGLYCWGKKRMDWFLKGTSTTLTINTQMHKQRFHIPKQGTRGEKDPKACLFCTERAVSSK